MLSENVIALTRKLVSFNTINPPGNEKEPALFLGDILKKNGFDVEYIRFEDSRLHLIAEKGISSKMPPVVLSGHLDTVPLGTEKWSVDPFAGEIIDGKLYGRGTTDMKGGVAAIVIAAIQSFNKSMPPGGVKLIITAGEELGCQGAQQLVRNHKNLGTARGMIIAEPTSNIPATGHKGGLYLKVTTTGKTAHSSMPELGNNAIYKAARAITKTENFSFDAEKDELLGWPTLNVGKMSGGLNLNSVPDHAEFTIDIRSTTKVNHSEIIDRLGTELGNEANIETMVNLNAIATANDEMFVKTVYTACNIDPNDSNFPKALPYLTDGSVLKPAMGNVPTVILGPGEPDMAHKTDEFIYIDKLEKSVEIYKRIISDS